MLYNKKYVGNIAWATSVYLCSLLDSSECILRIGTSLKMVFINYFSSSWAEGLRNQGDIN